MIKATLKKISIFIFCLSLVFISSACSIPGKSTGSSEQTSVEETSASRFTGIWYEQIAGRGELIFTQEGDNTKAEIRWADADSDSYYWVMTGVPDEDDILAYNDCKLTIVSFVNSKTTTELISYENGEGYFKLQKDGTILWHDGSSGSSKSEDTIFQFSS